MASSLSTVLSLALKTAEKLLNDAFGSPTDNAQWPFTGVALSSGTGSGQADLVYRARRTIAAAGTDTLVLSALTDKFGNAVAFARVKVLAIANNSAVDTDVVNVGAAPTHPWESWTAQTGSKFKVAAGGAELKAAPLVTGFAVVASASDQLLIANPGANAITYDIVIVGASV